MVISKVQPFCMAKASNNRFQKAQNNSLGYSSSHNVNFKAQENQSPQGLRIRWPKVFANFKDSFNAFVKAFIGTAEDDNFIY